MTSEQQKLITFVLKCSKCNSYQIRFLSFSDTKVPVYYCDSCKILFILPELIKLEDVQREINGIKQKIVAKKIKIDKLPNPNENIAMSKEKWCKELNQELREIESLFETLLSISRR